jgi:hypothetical protein
MSSIDTWPKPPWLEQTTDSADLNRYYLRLVIALCPDGRVNSVAKALGVTSNIMRLAKHRGVVSPDLAIRIEKLHGRAFCPREIFNAEPEIPGE